MPSYEEDLSEFERRNAQVLGISVDQVFSNEAWAKSMGGLSYPLLSDNWPYGYACVQYGVLRGEGRAERAIFVGDSPVDVAAARAAKIPVIAMSYGYTPVPADELGADAVTADFSGLPGLISRLVR